MSEPISRELLSKIVDEVFDGAIEDASVIEQIYASIKKHEAPPPSSHMRAPEGYALIPLVPTDEMIEAICRKHTRCHWPNDFDRTAQAIRRQDARDGYEIVIALAATATEGSE